MLALFGRALQYTRDFNDRNGSSTQSKHMLRCEWWLYIIMHCLRVYFTLSQHYGYQFLVIGFIRPTGMLLANSSL